MEKPMADEKMKDEKKPKTVKVGEILSKEKSAAPKAESKSPEHKKKKHVVHKMEVRRAGKGFITVHHSKDEAGNMMEPEETPHTDLDTVHDALEEHMGEANADEDQEPQPADSQQKQAV
jgi:hypothetical protein